MIRRPARSFGAIQTDSGIRGHTSSFVRANETDRRPRWWRRLMSLAFPGEVLADDDERVDVPRGEDAATHAEWASWGSVFRRDDVSDRQGVDTEYVTCCVCGPPIFGPNQ